MKTLQLVETNEADGMWLKILIDDVLEACFKITNENRDSRLKEAEAEFKRIEDVLRNPSKPTILKEVNL